MQASAMQACYRRSWRLACPATWRRPAQPQLRRVAVAAAEPDHQPDGAPHATRPHPPAGPPAAAGTRRQLLLAAAVLAASAAAGDGASRAAPAAAPPGALEGPSVVDVEQLRINAMQAYARQDFASAISNLSQLVQQEPREPKWREMRAQALVDAKDFGVALNDFDAALRLTPADAQLDRARLLAGRGLAFEGIGSWVDAVADYDEALRLAEAAGQQPDPYVLNSRGNCRASLGEWRAARADYLASAALFQAASGFQGPNGSTAPRLDGATFAAANAALMLAQLGDEPGAIHEMQAVTRRAPGNADMRAALAALYWAQGELAKAESEWEFACDRISVGCKAYQDEDWLFRVRRWPPVMVQRMKNFLTIRSSPRAMAAAAAAAAS